MPPSDAAVAAVDVTPARVLVAGVGYTNLADHSAGLHAIDRLGRVADHVDVEDFSYGAIDVLFTLQRRPPYRKAVFIAAVERGDPVGSVRWQRWERPAISAADLQEKVAEAVTGVVSLDNLLHITAHFGGLPEDVVVVEIEPGEERYGPAPSPVVDAAITEALRLARQEAGIA